MVVGWCRIPKARVAQLNLNGSLNHRVLVDFSGQLPPSARCVESVPQYRSTVERRASLSCSSLVSLIETGNLYQKGDH